MRETHKRRGRGKKKKVLVCVCDSNGAAFGALRHLRSC